MQALPGPARCVVTFLCPVDPAVPKLTETFSTDFSTVQEGNSTISEKINRPTKAQYDSLESTGDGGRLPFA